MNLMVTIYNISSTLHCSIYAMQRYATLCPVIHTAGILSLNPVGIRTTMNTTTMSCKRYTAMPANSILIAINCLLCKVALPQNPVEVFRLFL